VSGARPLNESDRMPPADEAAERAVLGAILRDPSRLAEARDLLAPADFWHPGHAVVFGVMLKLDDADPIRLADEIRRRRRERDLGELAEIFLGDLMDAVAHSANLAVHAAIVREKARLRGLIETATATLHEAYAGSIDSDRLAERLAGRGGLNSHSSLNSGPKEDEDVQARPWPDRPAEAAWAGPAGRLAEAIRPYTEADPVNVLVSTLAMFGNLVGRGAYWRVGASRHYCNVNAVMVGRTAGGRKGTGQAEAMRAVEPADEFWSAHCVKDGLSSGEGLLFAVRDPIYKDMPQKEKGRIVGYQREKVDQGAEDKRLLIVEEELGRVFMAMGREGNTLSPLLRQAFDGKSLRSLTKTPLEATDPHITIIGHITETELIRYLTDVQAANGFGNRFAWFLVKRSNVLDDPRPIPEAVLAGCTDALIAARAEHLCRCDREGGAYELRRDAEADAIWRPFYRRATSERPGLFGAMVARGAPIAMRLAMVYAILDGSPVIGGSHMQSAVALWDYAEASAAYLFGDIMGDPEADAVLSALHANPGGLTQTDISVGVFNRHKPAKMIARALGRLLEMGLVESEKVEGSGRPATVWRCSSPAGN
jgi:hypothetical protein